MLEGKCWKLTQKIDFREDGIYVHLYVGSKCFADFSFKQNGHVCCNIPGKVGNGNPQQRIIIFAILYQTKYANLFSCLAWDTELFSYKKYVESIFCLINHSN